MTNKILKASAALAIGTLLLVPSTKEVYATSTNTATSTDIATAEKEFKETLNNVSSEIKRYYSFTDSYQYKNADQDPQIDYNNALLGLEKAYDDYKNLTTSDADLYRLYTKTLKTMISKVETAKAKLNGREVDKTELFNLLSERSNFQSEEAYKNAPKDLQEKYDTAIFDGYKAFGNDGQNMSNLQNESAVKSIKDAKNKITNHENRRKALASLREEITLSSEIISNKSVYTDKSYNKYYNAVILAKSTIENPSSTLDEIKSAKNLAEFARKELVKKPTASDISREEQIKKLKEAIKKNNETRRAAELVKKLSPNIAAKNIDYLNKLINNSKNIVSRSTKVLNQLKGIRG